MRNVVGVVATPPRRTYLSSVGTPMTFLERLEKPETLREEVSHLWRWRFGSTAFTAVILYLLYNWWFQNGFPPFYFLWVLNFAGLGYGRWPRQRISHELTTDIEKFEGLIRDRNVRMRDLTGGAPTTNLTLAEFINEKLRATAIDHAHDPSTGIAAATVRNLKIMGIENAYMLKQSIHSPEIGKLSSDQVTVLSNWFHGLEDIAMVEYGKVNAKRRSNPDADRLRGEIGELERHVNALKQERDLFPDASFPAYLRKLAGLHDASTNSPASGTTP